MNEPLLTSASFFVHLRATIFYVAADEIEPKDSDWGKIASTPGIYVLGKRFDRFYEVVVDESYIPWLLYHKFRFLNRAELEFLLCYDPTQPTKVEVEVYGWGGFYVRSLGNIFKAIWSRHSQGLESCLRSIATPALQTALEWAILDRDIQVDLWIFLFMSKSTDGHSDI